MEQCKRGLPLTLCAIAFSLLAISDLTKPFSQSHDPHAGLVFFGTKLTATADLIIAPLFAAFLAVYAIGIWRMKRLRYADVIRVRDLRVHQPAGIEVRGHRTRVLKRSSSISRRRTDITRFRQRENWPAVGRLIRIAVCTPE
jgi:hypothetical protein